QKIPERGPTTDRCTLTLQRCDDAGQELGDVNEVGQVSRGVSTTPARSRAPRTIRPALLSLENLKRLVDRRRLRLFVAVRFMVSLRLVLSVRLVPTVGRRLALRCPHPKMLGGQ